ncbi:hypothetical protein CYLTODRAFT_417244 [Cylindrobasidium torrendii FP15055 ss-10]|uniref:Uncharacterized protein n=1 Tax=Cylindrobasidium torrendii FP15055 ss-10 TaxID=1314674 RepID=A0A0D7BSZ4_9AGAR|nr:hypothetical protein CYLTODRAFT_417244 [Cylindrobasidium torrendii FP15055 ss-10]
MALNNPIHSRIPIHTSILRRPSPSALPANSKTIDSVDPASIPAKPASRIPVRRMRKDLSNPSKEPSHMHRRSQNQVMKIQHEIVLTTPAETPVDHPSFAVRPLNVKSKGLVPQGIPCSTQFGAASLMPKITAPREVVSAPSNQHANSNGKRAEKIIIRPPIGRRRSSTMQRSTEAARIRATNLRKVSKKTRKGVQWGRARTSASPKKFVSTVKPILKKQGIATFSFDTFQFGNSYKVDARTLRSTGKLLFKASRSAPRPRFSNLHWLRVDRWVDEEYLESQQSSADAGSYELEDLEWVVCKACKEGVSLAGIHYREDQMSVWKAHKDTCLEIRKMIEAEREGLAL